MIILHAGERRPDDLRRATRYLSELAQDKAWKLEVTQYKRTRSVEQNSYLWGVCYQTLLREGGDVLQGWEAEDLHDYFLGEHFGWETIEGFGRKRLRPLKRSSRLSTTEFAEYVEFVQRKAAGMGIYIPDPNEGEP